MTPKSQFKCPACDQPLSVMHNPAAGYLLWCGNGQCNTYAANMGKDGPTEKAAYDELVAAVEKEKETK